MEDAHESHDDEVESDVHSDGDNQEAEAMEIVSGENEGGEEGGAAGNGEVAVEAEVEAEAGALQVVDTQMVRARDPSLFPFSPPST
jgi:hypothetical protein